jgi:hypothetical protein
MAEPGGPRALRLSDSDRELAVNDLKAHAAAGRLSADELGERVAKVYGARDFGDLAEIMADLPELGGRRTVVRPTTTRGRRAPLRPGVRPFTEIAEVTLPPSEVRQRVLEHLARPLAECGYELVDAGDEQLEFLFSGRTSAFSLPRRLSIRVTLEPLGEGRTRLLAHGKAPLLVRRAFATLGSL